MALTGPRTADRIDAVAPFSLFGGDHGDYVAGAFPAGAYTLTAEPYLRGHGARGALPPATVSFTVTGGLAGMVSRFVVVDAEGPAPDPDVAVIGDGDTLRGPAWPNFRAEVADPALVGSMRLELRGPVGVTRTAPRAPYLLFGASGDDAHPGSVPDGAYTLTARPFAPADRGGAALPPQTVSFTMTGSGADAPKVTGFALVDATGGPPDPDVLALRPDSDAAIYLTQRREYSFRADAGPLAPAHGLRMRLSGPATASRLEKDDGSPYTVFGGEGTDVQGWPLPPGRYLIEAAPMLRNGRHLTPQSAVLTLLPPDLSVAPVSGFTLVDAGTDVDVGPLADGGTVDASALADGTANVRVAVARERPDLRSVAFELRGPRTFDRVDDGPPYSLFGERDGDYVGGVLPNGAYTLTGRPHARNGGRGAALKTTTVAFTVTGGHAPDAPAVTGFALRDSADSDLGGLLDGSVLDLSSTPTGAVSIRGGPGGASPGREKRGAQAAWPAQRGPDARRGDVVGPVRTRRHGAAERRLHADRRAAPGSGRARRGAGGNFGHVHRNGQPRHGCAGADRLRAGGRRGTAAGSGPRRHLGRRRVGPRQHGRLGERARRPSTAAGGREERRVRTARHVAPEPDGERPGGVFAFRRRRRRLRARGVPRRRLHTRRAALHGGGRRRRCPAERVGGVHGLRRHGEPGDGVRRRRRDGSAAGPGPLQDDQRRRDLELCGHSRGECAEHPRGRRRRPGDRQHASGTARPGVGDPHGERGAVPAVRRRRRRRLRRRDPRRRLHADGTPLHRRRRRRRGDGRTVRVLHGDAQPASGDPGARVHPGRRGAHGWLGAARQLFLHAAARRGHRPPGAGCDDPPGGADDGPVQRTRGLLRGHRQRASGPVGAGEVLAYREQRRVAGDPLWRAQDLLGGPAPVQHPGEAAAPGQVPPRGDALHR